MRGMQLRRSGSIVAAALVLGVAGCAPTSVAPTYERVGPMRRPERILVYEFAVAPDEVHLEKGLSAEVIQAVQGTPRSVEEREIGRTAARALADELVSKIQAMGIPAEHAYGAPLRWSRAVVIEGQFLSIDQGNRTERVVIGLGLGRSDVKTDVQVYATTYEGLERLADFETTAYSGYKPGMAETMGAGAAAGHLAVSAAVSTVGAVASEALSDTVKADAERTASGIAKKLQAYFAEQGWVPPEE